MLQSMTGSEWTRLELQSQQEAAATAGSWKASLERQGSSESRRQERREKKAKLVKQRAGCSWRYRGGRKQDEGQGWDWSLTGLACKGQAEQATETWSAMVTAHSIWEAIMQGSEDSSWQQSS